MIAKEQKPFVFENMCNCKYDFIDLSLAMVWYSDFNLHSKKKIFLNGRYPAVSIGYEKIHIHRLLISWDKKRKLRTSEHVHHIDGDIFNNELNNLVLMACKDHISKHLKGKKQDKELSLRRTNKTCNTRYGHNTRQYNIIHEVKE